MTKTDHRPRVNAERRRRMRRRLIECALLVIADKGVRSSHIDDVMKMADVSRGGFYRHFRSMGALLAALGEELGNETLHLIEGQVVGVHDPAQRLAAGLLLCLQMARRNRLLARFITAVGLDVNSPTSLIHVYLPRHLDEGVRAGAFTPQGHDVALDLIGGAMLEAMARIAAGDDDEDYPQRMVMALMTSLGMPQDGARVLVERHLPPIELPGDSLLWRSHLRSLASPALAA